MYNLKGKNIKGAIFDLDGTLLDSLGVWKDIDIKFLSKRGFDVPEDYAKNISALSFREVAEYTVRYFELRETAEEIMDEWFYMSKIEYGSNIFLKPYAKEFLFMLKNSGVKLCTATNLPDELSNAALINNGIYDLFDAFCETQEVGKSKQFPDVFYLAAQKLNVPADECAVFEDIPHNILSAKTAGMYTCGVYDSHAEYYKQELQKCSDIYIECFKDLID